MIYTVSENVEIVLDGKKYLLEAGDQIVVEAYVSLERTYETIAEKVSEQFKVTSEQIAAGLDESLFNEIKNFIKAIVRQDPEFNFRVTDGVVSDILVRVSNLTAPSDEWKQADLPPSDHAMAQFAGEKEKLAQQKAAERQRLQEIMGES